MSHLRSVDFDRFHATESGASRAARFELNGDLMGVVDFSLAGKTAIVTGGSKGIGRAIATAFAEHGADVAIVARGGETLEDARAESRPAAYSASKHGIVGLSKTAALDYAKRNIQVNTVCPGPVQTPMVDTVLNAQSNLAGGIIEAISQKEPVGRFGTPEEIAESIIWLCSDAASFVTSAVLAVDGGLAAQ